MINNEKDVSGLQKWMIFLKAIRKAFHLEKLNGWCELGFTSRCVKCKIPKTAFTCVKRVMYLNIIRKQT